MATTYDDAIKAQLKIEDRVLLDPNVVSVGVVAARDAFGKPTGDYVVQVGVMSLEAFGRAHNHGESVIPDEVLIESDEGQQSKHIHINVVGEGKIEALSKRVIYENESDIPSAIDDLAETTNTTYGTTSKYRPSPCGYSVGHPDVTAGTLGLVLEYTEGPNVGKAYILSNNHVLAANNAAFVGDAITQPGTYDSGSVLTDTIANLHRWVPLKTSSFNYVDAAIAQVCGGKNGWSSCVSPYITRIGLPKETVKPTTGMRVEKFGRTTGYTTGEIISTSYTTKIAYPMGTLAFKNQIQTTNMSKGGDSGSCVVEHGSKSPVGLLFAGSNKASYCNPISVVLSMLSEPHKNSYPSGKVHEFKQDFPLQIIKQQKHSYSTYTGILNTKKSPARVSGRYKFALGMATLLFTGTKKGYKLSQPQVAKNQFNFFRQQQSKKPVMFTNENKLSCIPSATAGK